MRYLSVAEVTELHDLLIERFGGASGIHNQHALESSVLQPQQTFGGHDLYVGVVAKAAALGYFLGTNHAFVDGNKRVAHAALEITLVLNGFELSASVDEQEALILKLASGEISREDFTKWVEAHSQARGA